MSRRFVKTVTCLVSGEVMPNKELDMPLGLAHDIRHIPNSLLRENVVSYLIPVRYSREWAEEMTRSIVQSTISLLKDAGISDLSDSDANTTYVVAVGLLTLLLTILGCKHPKFAEESEWRIVVLHLDEAQKAESAEYRTNSVALVPTFRLSLAWSQTGWPSLLKR